jgi:hypothetical protein
MDTERLAYAFGHLVSSHMTDAHAGDSADEANDVLNKMELTVRERDIIYALSEKTHEMLEGARA